MDEQDTLRAQIVEIETRLQEFNSLKRVLTSQSERLVDAVIEVFRFGLSLSLNREEAFREDFELVNEAAASIALVEVKGVSRGVTREHINQADSHRERNGKLSDFPSLLIVNGHMRNAASLADKDHDIASEQIQHAARMNVLILRVLDLLNLAKLVMAGKLTSLDIIQLLTTSSGWLKVGEKAEIVQS